MITKAQLEAVNAVMHGEDLPELTENAGVIARADTGPSEGSPAPAIHNEQLHALAAAELRTAAAFAATGERRNARHHLELATQFLNEAEIED